MNWGWLSSVFGHVASFIANRSSNHTNSPAQSQLCWAWPSSAPACSCIFPLCCLLMQPSFCCLIPFYKGIVLPWQELFLKDLRIKCFNRTHFIRHGSLQSWNLCRSWRLINSRLNTGICKTKVCSQSSQQKICCYSKVACFWAVRVSETAPIIDTCRYVTSNE